MTRWIETRAALLALILIFSAGCQNGSGSGGEGSGSSSSENEGNDNADEGDRDERSSSTGDIPAPDDVAEPPANAEKTESGLASRVLEKGTGSEHPSARDRVTVHYTGWTTDGKMFDSSKRRRRPAVFPLNRVIKGWTEGVQLMVKGEKRRFWIPEELAYKGRPGAPAGMLVFDIELLDIL